MKTKILSLFMLLSIGFGTAQEVRTCESQEVMEEQLKDPKFRAGYEALQAKFERRYAELEALGGDAFFQREYIIPVAVHYPTASASNRECLVELAEDQVRILNEDFNSKNSDISKWENDKSTYPGVVNGVCNFKFVLATKNHPSGSGVNEGEPAVTVGQSFGTSTNKYMKDSKWAGYMNFVVRSLDGGILGYSALGGQPREGAAVVQTNTAFGSEVHGGCPGFTPSTSFNLGRTVTHELGHQYNLRHVWGNCNSNCCGQDDLVSDTPETSGPHYQCPSTGSKSSCQSGKKALTMNYMDYVNDACMYMFTEGQAKRMLAYMDVIHDDYDQDTLSSDSFSLDNSFSIFPNPAKDEFRIVATNNVLKDNTKVELYDLLGKVVKTSIIDNVSKGKVIDVRNLNNGLYLLKVTSGNSSITKKIVVNR